jgi:hypothetical protein
MQALQGIGKLVHPDRVKWELTIHAHGTRVDWQNVIRQECGSDTFRDPVRFDDRM